MQPRVLLLALLLICSLSASPATAGLLGYWKFDSVGTFLQDASGNGYHATSFSGNANDGFDNTTSAQGGGSAKFVTGGAGGFQVQLPASLASHFSNQGAISMWVKRATATPAADNGSGLMDLSIGGNAATHYPYSNGLGYFGDFRNSRVDAVPLTTVNRAEWHHVAIVADTSGGAGASRYSVYQDGVSVVNNLADTFNFTYGATFGGVARLGMSHTAGNTGVAYLGNLDDVSLYNQPLSQAQVKLLAMGLSPQLVASDTKLTSINLADIVGGGNGKGTGTAGAGLAMGAVNSFTTSAHPLIDGVVLPDGNTGSPVSIPVSSTGILASGIANSDGASYDLLRNGHNTAVSSTLSFDSILGAHASKGITFDLDAILADNPNTALQRFLGYAAKGNTAVGDGITFYVLVDGEIRDSVFLNAANSRSLLDVPLVQGDRFLTLLTLAGANSSNDWSFFGNAQVVLASVPEPSTWLLTALGLLGLAAYRRRRIKT